MYSGDFDPDSRQQIACAVVYKPEWFRRKTTKRNITVKCSSFKVSSDFSKMPADMTQTYANVTLQPKQSFSRGRSASFKADEVVDTEVFLPAVTSSSSTGSHSSSHFHSYSGTHGPPGGYSLQDDFPALS